MDARETLDQVCKRLMPLQHASGEAADLARDLLGLIQRGMQSDGGGEPDGVLATGGVKYCVEKSALGETLAEYRPQGKPLRCPKGIYDAVATALAEANGPMSVGEIVRAVDRQTGGSSGEFQIRVALRCWTTVVPSALLRARARYRAAVPHDLRAQADRLWQQLQA